MDWIEALEKAVNRQPVEDEETDQEFEGGEDEGGEDEEVEETPAPRNKARKGVKDPKPNGETGNHGGEPAVHDPRSLDRRTNGGPVRKSLDELVEEGTQDAIDASQVLRDLTKAINTVAVEQAAVIADQGAQIATLTDRVGELSKGMKAIGQGVVASLEEGRTLAKSLSAEVEEMGRQPAGRKSIVKGVERKFQGGDAPAAGALPNAQTIMAKSMKGVQQGKIDAFQASSLETAYNQGRFDLVQAIWNRIADL